MLLLMEKPQALTCILCKKQIPAEEHTHHCEDGNSVEVLKIFLGYEMPEHLKKDIKSSKNAFAIRADVSTTIKCSFCNKNEVSVIKQVTANGEFVPKPMCDDCQKSREIEARELEKENRRKMEEAHQRYLKRLPQYLKQQEKIMMEEGVHMTQCEYCGQMLTLTKEDFVEHQDACKADNAQI